MTSKKRRPRKNLDKFNVKGHVPNLKNEIDEWTSAASERQALLQIQRRLEEKFGVPVYLGNCTVTRGERKR